MTSLPTASFPQLLQDFFAQRLCNQQQASPRTVASYRDAFRLLLECASEQTGKSPVCLTLQDLDVPLIVGFLEHLETNRRCSPRSRNARLAAIRSFLRYASFFAPDSLPTIQRVLAIPFKRYDRPLLGFLTREQMEAVLSVPDRSSFSGHRDYVMLSTFYNTGARVSEVIGLRVRDAHLDSSAWVRIHGKGRKDRVVPLWKTTAAALRRWLAIEPRSLDAPLFPNRNGTPMSRSGVEDRLRAAVKKAEAGCPSLTGLRISPHTLRHTTAMHLLQSGVDLSVIALWLGHENPTTTHLYIEADLALKERALSKLQAPSSKPLRFPPATSCLNSSTACDYAQSWQLPAKVAAAELCIIRDCA